MIVYLRPPTMFGFHVSIGSRNGFGDFLANCAAAGRAVSGTKCFKNGGGLETTSASPKSYVVWRTDVQYHFSDGHWDDYSDNPPYDYTWPPGQSATIAKGWMEGCWRIWQYNPADFYEPYNEPNPSNVLQMQNLIAFSRECMRLADTQYGGIKLAIGGFSSGTPSEAFIEMMSPLLDEMAQGGHILALHDGAATPEYVLFKDAYDAGSALRWRLWKSIQDSHNRAMPYVYSTETYCPEFYHEYGDPVRQADMLWYLQECAKDDYLLGTAMFELGEYNFGGGSVNLEGAIPTIQEIVMQLTPIESDPEPVPLPSNSTVLDIKYLDQNNKVSANDSLSDCGAACLAMLLASRGLDVTVNDVFRRTKALPGQPITFAQLKMAATSYGYTLEDRRNCALNDLDALLRDKVAPILLVNARYLNQPGKAVPYTGAHYVVLVGATSDGFMVHDPNNLPATIQPDLAAAWGNCHLQGNPDNAMLILREGAPEPPSITTFALGVGMGNRVVPSPTEVAAIHDARLDAVKVLTLADPDENRAMIDILRQSLGDSIHVMARLFFDVDDENRRKFSPGAFVEFVKGAALALYEKGVRDYEVHNEPNLSYEGWGFNWPDGASFSNWYREVIGLLRGLMPEARFGFPGLSPGDTVLGVRQDAISFWQEARAAIQASDFICLHSYWHQERGYWGMDNLTGGMSWRLCPANGKPRVISEFSNNLRTISPTTKAAQYIQYAQMLRATGQVSAAYAFVLSWDGGGNLNNEAWVVDGHTTDIPAIVGSRSA